MINIYIRYPQLLDPLDQQTIVGIKFPGLDGQEYGTQRTIEGKATRQQVLREIDKMLKAIEEVVE